MHLSACSYPQAGLSRPRPVLAPVVSSRITVRVQATPDRPADVPEPAGPSGRPVDSEVPPPLTEQITRSLSEVSKGSKRGLGGTNLLLVGESEESWRRLDNKVNKYPIQRSFTAIGTGGAEFRQAMVQAVEKVVGSVHSECVSERMSSQRNYISVTVGPVWVENGDQIIAVYANMKADSRAKWII